MEIKEFQAKLSEALGLAVENGKKIHADTVEGIFAGNGLTEGQMQKVYEYLAIQGKIGRASCRERVSVLV